MLLKNIVIYMAGTVGLVHTSTDSKSVMLPITSYPIILVGSALIGILATSVSPKCRSAQY